MVNTPYNPFLSSVQSATVPAIYLGATDGSDIELTDEIRWLLPKSVRRSVGGRNLDQAHFDVDLGRLGVDVTDMATPSGWSRQLEMRILDDAGEPLQPMFWGEVVQQQLQIDSANVVASIQPFHFGSVLEGMQVWDPIGDEVVLLHDDLVFNPQIDDKIVGNMSSENHPTTATHRLWVDPESARTENARETQDDITVSEWTLDKAVRSLCYLLNPDESFIFNAVTDGDTIFENAPALKNVVIPRGIYLSDALDRLLDPHGYGWFVGLDIDQATLTLKRQVKLFKRGDSGLGKKIYLQRHGETINNTDTNVEKFNVTTDIASMANRVVAVGDYERAEITHELVKNWDAADESGNEYSFQKSGGSFESYQNVWRLWVGNEAGDVDPDNPSDFSGIFSDAIPRRRPMTDCLTLDENGRRRKIVVEYYDEATSAWKQVTSSYRILEDQIGVYFDGDLPPKEIMKQSNPRVRVTGTIRGDTRLKVTVDRDESSPNLRDVTLYLDLSDRFFDQFVATSSMNAEFASQFDGDANGSDEKLDEPALTTYATEVRDLEDAAAIRVDITLNGIEFGYELGDVISEIYDRGIDLNAKSPESNQKRRPQITAIGYHHNPQRTQLELSIAELPELD